VDVLSVVRRAARRRISDASVVAALEGAVLDWRGAEQALAAELGASPRRAERLVEEFERAAVLSVSDEARGRAARLRASHLTYRGRFAESRRAYRRAVSLLTGAARDGARIGLAAAEARLGRFDAARALCRAVRRDAERRGDAALAAAADLNEAVALHEAGRPRDALPLYVRAAYQS
jgi:tetratricopeptide (TPR) repeat protein